MPISDTERLTLLTLSHAYTPVLLLCHGETREFNFTCSLNTFLAPSHGLVNGCQIRLSGGNLPVELNSVTPYYLVAVTPGSFQLSLSPGGSAIAFNASGSGTATEQQPNASTPLLAWVNREVSYQGESRKTWAWGAPLQSGGTVNVPAVEVSFAPTLDAIDYRYLVVLRGGSTASGSAAGQVAFYEDMGNSIIGDEVGKVFTITPYAIA